MPNNGKAKRPKAGKKQELLAKPKRPMSAYNFFFRAERAKILREEPAEQQSGSNKTSFEDIGRIIGQRWRAIDPHELAKYKKMAKEDNDRYRDQMKGFYRDELTLMCQGHNDGAVDAGTLGGSNGGDGKERSAESGAAVSASRAAGAAAAINPVAVASAHGDQKYPAAAASSDQSRSMMGLMPPLAPMFVNQGQPHASSQHRSNAVAAAAAMSPFAASYAQAPAPGPSSTPSFAQAPVFAMDGDQILQLLVQHQQSCNSPSGARIPNDTVVALILNQKASLQQRERKLAEEMNGLQLRGALLDKMLAHEVNALPPPEGKPQGGDGGGANGDAASMELLLQALQQQKPAGANAGPEHRAPAEAAAQQQQQQAMHLSHLFGNGAPVAPPHAPVAPPPMQEMLYRNNNVPAAVPSLAYFLPPQAAGMNAPGAGTNQQGDAMSMEEMVMKLSSSKTNDINKDGT